MARTFQVPAMLTGLSTRARKEYGLRFVTNYEMSTEDAVTMLSFHNQRGWLLFRENEFNDDEVPAGDSPDSRKTPGQRLRGVLYRVFQETGKPVGEFNSWYVSQMESIIQHFKDKLP